MTKTSHKKNRPFDFKLISLVEPHPVLYVRQMPGMSNFEIMKTKNKIWQEIAGQMGFPVQFCLSRWNNLRANFQKELKQSNELCPISGIIRGSTWPYLERLRFLESTLQTNKPKKEKRSKKKLKEEIPDLLHETEDGWDSEDSEPKLPDNDIKNDIQMDLSPTIQQNNPLEDVYEDSFSMIEEIAEEVVGTEEYHIVDDTTENFPRIETLLMGFQGESSRRIERRLLAFLCKCQLRSLCHQSIDDLFV